MDQQQIQSAVISVMEIILKCKITSQTTRKNMPSWDSLKHIEIVFSLEDELGIDFSEEELKNLNSVQQISETIYKHHAP